MSTVVVDASVLVDALLPGPRSAAARATLSGASVLAAPEHLGVEVLSVLRRLSLRNDSVPAAALDTARRTLVALDLDLVGLAELQDRIWSLRHVLTSYDAAYVAAAEHLEATLVTSDASLLGCPHLGCPVLDPRAHGAS
ncbi:PIN domain-containing protein [Allosaccharopolyspora coralli]|uniref:Ribonuclease VapC n=1 Tax=Allosaccharopolyspora coralli TaxID=2665642 RepID=A0A5Q3QC87_9PSEU|nr:type II toxin-antitoxin system VapC family toxin [Allosaccharopolyspora coralli]QGK70854.1 PIN domain-containing protein [Allosaccharopolyspora coralli]